MELNRMSFLIGITIINTLWLIAAPNWWIDRVEEQRKTTFKDTFVAVVLVGLIPMTVFTLTASYLAR